MNPYFLRSAVYASILSLVICSLYYLARFDLDNDFLLGFKLCGLSLFLFLCPVYLDFLLRKALVHNTVNQLLFGIILLLLIGMLGWLGLASTCYLFLFLGYLFFFVALVFFASTIRTQDLVGLFILLIFSLWIASIVWSGGFLNPIFIEKLLLGNFNDASATGLDPLFHISYAQMIKTYGVASTGLNGLPFMKYHVGSHIISSEYSKFLNINVFYFYNLGYPVLFIPLFFQFFFNSIFYFRKFIIKGLSSFNYPFWAFILVGFIGIFDTSSEGFTVKAGAYWNSVLISESYLISLIFLFTFLTCLLDFVSEDQRNSSYSKIILFLIFPVLTFSLGLCKISTLFNLFAILTYLYFRLKLFKVLKYNISLMLCFLAFILISFLAFETSGSGTKFEILAFYWNYIHIKFIIFILVYFFWTIVFIALDIFRNTKTFKRSEILLNFHKKNYLLAEVMFFISVMGFLPGFFLKIPGGSATYFSEIQNWLGLILVISCYPVIEDFFFRIKSKFLLKTYLKIPLILLCLFFVYNLSKNVLRHFQIAVDANFISRSWYAGYVNDPRTNIENALYRGDFKRIKEVLDSIGVPVRENLNKNREYSIIRQLFGLDSSSLSLKRMSVAHVSDYGDIKRVLPCFKYPYIIPAISGIACYGSYVFNDCPHQAYGMEFYTNSLKKRGTKEVCQDNVAMRLYLIDFSLSKLEKIDCHKKKSILFPKKID